VSAVALRTVRFRRSGFSLALALAGSAALGACTTSARDGDDGAAVGRIEGSSCLIEHVKERRVLTSEEFARLDDAVATKILAGDACPKTFEEIQKKLSSVEGDEECKSNTFTISERSMARGLPDSYREVVSHGCGGVLASDVMMSLFGVRPGAAPLPGDVELIAKDRTTGAYNYYAREQGRWRFFGNSFDLIADGYDCDANGACTPKAANKTRCAGCHVSGGLNMKELNFPWVHWEGVATTPGRAELFSAHQDLLGESSHASNLENIITSGNGAYDQKRIEFLKSKGVAEVLRPLFCTMEVSLSSGVSSEGSPLTRIPAELVLDFQWQRVFAGSTAFDVNDADYRALIPVFNQRLLDRRARPVLDKDGVAVTDTHFGFTFPKRSTRDNAYIAKLMSSGIVDRDFVADVLHIDFTRASFSAARCDLLHHAPELPPEQMTPDAIREGFKTSLANGEGLAAKSLLANLSQPDDQAQHIDDIRAFLEACNGRDRKELLADLMTFASHQRRASRAIVSSSGQGIIEFAESMVFDDIPDTPQSLDPITCRFTAP